MDQRGKKTLTGKRKKISGLVHVRFVVDKVALGQVFLRVVGFSLSIHSIGAPLLVRLGKNCSYSSQGCTKILKAVVRL
jgi:hypothetical protein